MDASISVSNALSLESAGDAGVVVTSVRGGQRVILAERLKELARTQGSTPVGELASELPEVGPELEFAGLVSRIGDEGVDALLVSGPKGGTLGVVTRAEIASALLELHAVEGPLAAKAGKNTVR